MAGNPFIPFFVADRPASLKILRGVQFRKYDGRLGIMAHANTSRNFQSLMKQFPCVPQHSFRRCDRACLTLEDRIVKMADSGVFTKAGREVDYPPLFEAYERMGVEYGIMIDFLRQKDKTLKSAMEGVRAYNSTNWSFKLVGVAQGRSVREYLECYNRLQNLGFDHIAVGGLLRKRSNTSHYTFVRGNGILFEVLEALRAGHPNDWLFALGCYHPSRHLRFQRLDLFGSDYKGWIFNYKPQNQLGKRLARSARYRQVRRFIAGQIFESPFYLNGRKKEISKVKGKPKTLVIVACGSKKIWDVDPNHGRSRARDAYVGRYFVENRRYAETFADTWAILSAKYGLVPPNFLISGNYNVRFNHRSETVTTRRIREQVIDQGFHRFAKVVVLGGREYGLAIEEAYAGTAVQVLRPLERHKSIGRMMQSVQRALALNEKLEMG